jgi:AcrR family transcriptional regulator
MEAELKTPPPKRRRRSPEEAEREIVVAAETLLRQRPFREFTVDEVMRRTDLSRPSFYVYFKDRHALILRVVERIGAELGAMSAHWFSTTGPGPERIEAAIHGIVEVYEEHGPVLRALAEAASDDPDVEHVYGDLVRGFVDASAELIEAEMEAGHVRPMDARRTAEALVWMNERVLNTHFGVQSDVVGEDVARALTTVWSRTLYGA